MNHSKWNGSSHFASHHVKTLHSDMYHLSRDLAGRGRCQHSAGAEYPGSAGWQKSELHWYGVCHPIFGVCHHKLINYYLLFPLAPSSFNGCPKTQFKHLWMTGVCSVKCLCIWIIPAFRSRFFYLTQISSTSSLDVFGMFFLLSWHCREKAVLDLTCSPTVSCLL